jgi:hypothetical protein
LPPTQDDDHLLAVCAVLVAGRCPYCARALLGLWRGSDYLLDRLDAILPVERVHRPGAWARIRDALALRGHDHAQDRAEDWKPLLDFLGAAIHSQVDPARMPPQPQVPAVFDAACD